MRVNYWMSVPTCGVAISASFFSCSCCSAINCFSHSCRGSFHSGRDAFSSSHTSLMWPCLKHPANQPIRFNVTKSISSMTTFLETMTGVCYFWYFIDQDCGCFVIWVWKGHWNMLVIQFCDTFSTCRKHLWCNLGKESLSKSNNSKELHHAFNNSELFYIYKVCIHWLKLLKTVISTVITLTCLLF